MEFLEAKKFKKEIKKLYTEAFPWIERAPIRPLFRKSENENQWFYAVFDEGVFVGLIYGIREESLVYLFYLAVVTEKRKHGYGGKILKEVERMFPDCTITLAIEDTEKTDAQNYEQRITRLHFYEGNGYKKTGIKINEVGVEFELLGTNNNVTKMQFLKMMRKYFGPLRFWNIYRKNKVE